MERKMADYIEEFPITLSTEGDTIASTSAWGKIVQEISRVYSLLSENARLSYGETAPTGPVDSHICWIL